MIYGYSRKQINPYGLLEMREVTFSAPPQTLRQIAAFLSQMADAMEVGEFDRCSHRHIGNVIDDWNRDTSGDIIVVPPA